MDHFEYRADQLFCEDVSIADIAAAVGTPFYCYSTATLERHFNVLKEALSSVNPLICYAVKANSNVAVLKTLGQLGAGADVVSVGEIKRALKAGIPAERIVYSGVGKTAEDMAYALNVGVYQINAESDVELAQLNRVAANLGKVAQVAIRVNPDVDGETHEKIRTGTAEDKFGIAWTQIPSILAHLKEMPHIELKGLTVHIGSQLTKLAPFKAAFERVRDLFLDIRQQGFPLERMDLGGGLGISYDHTMPAPPGPDLYGQVIAEVFGDLEAQFIVEPGRLIAGNAGIMVTALIYLKEGEKKNFAIMDAAMNDLMRPALYDALHAFIPVERDDKTPTITADIVGPVCESGDRFGKDIIIPKPISGQLFAFRSAGAYSASMSSTYNTRPLIPEVLVKDDKFAIIRPRICADSLIAMEALPDWQSE